MFKLNALCLIAFIGLAGILFQVIECQDSCVCMMEIYDNDRKVYTKDLTWTIPSLNKKLACENKATSGLKKCHKMCQDKVKKETRQSILKSELG